MRLDYRCFLHGRLFVAKLIFYKRKYVFGLLIEVIVRKNNSRDRFEMRLRVASTFETFCFWFFETFVRYCLTCCWCFSLWAHSLDWDNFIHFWYFNISLILQRALYFIYFIFYLTHNENKIFIVIINLYINIKWTPKSLLKKSSISLSIKTQPAFP